MVQEIHSRPSDFVCIEDRLTAYLFDSAVVTFGSLMENALAERKQVGIAPNIEWQNKYTLDQLLDLSFHLPDPARPVRVTFDGSNSVTLPPFESGIASILALADQQGSRIKRWVYQAPADGGIGESGEGVLGE